MVKLEILNAIISYSPRVLLTTLEAVPHPLSDWKHPTGVSQLAPTCLRKTRASRMLMMVSWSCKSGHRSFQGRTPFLNVLSVIVVELP